MKKEVKFEKISTQLKGNQRRKGKNHSIETKQQISLHNKGYHWFNNEQIEIKAKECPNGFIKGRLKKEGHWYTDFNQNVWSKTQPTGEKWVQGRYSYNLGKHWISDGTRNYLTTELINLEKRHAGFFYGMKRKTRTLKPKEIKKYSTKIPIQSTIVKTWVPDNKPIEPLAIKKLEKSIITQTVEKIREEDRKQLEEQKKLIANTHIKGADHVWWTADEFEAWRKNRTPSKETMELLKRFDD